MLMAQGELDLGTIMLLDKVQKGQRIDADEAKRLKAAKRLVKEKTVAAKLADLHRLAWELDERLVALH